MKLNNRNAITVFSPLRHELKLTHKEFANVLMVNEYAHFTVCFLDELLYLFNSGRNLSKARDMPHSGNTCKQIGLSSEVIFFFLYQYTVPPLNEVTNLIIV